MSPKKSPPKLPAANDRAAPKPPPAVHHAAQARSDEGQGKSLAVIVPEHGRAPWMAYAVAEAKRHKGANEAEIEKSINYATEVHTGQKTMVGNDHPWCAAFVNWCLMKAGYPIENLAFYDHVAAKGRAHGVFEISGVKNKSTGKAPRIRNPLFVELPSPVFGAIALVMNKASHGHHVGFVYAVDRPGRVVLLGGNQGDQINFSPFDIDDGDDHLRFFVPVSYQDRAKSDSITLPQVSAEDLNNEFGVVVNRKRRRGTR